MDPMNSIWYFLELQRRLPGTDLSRVEHFAKPAVRKSIKERLGELAVPLFVVAAVVAFGLVCLFYPTFVS
ncbi:MAG: hypothetical protein JOZ31_22095 [Verrucomicrobia bacterium]|nr:hypothetical protein [Verrucomicrobiota bacterium]MBV8482476.1 hypothetical protein [Verrucomicrobiota bacterium]